MCGLVGYFGAQDVDLAPAAATILHRGPDMQRLSRGRDWQVAFNRLAIIDTSEGGMQPFTFDRVTVIMNGEIYNYRELKEEHKREYTCHSGSDVEIVPFLYRKYGIRFLQKLNGMFAMALMDERDGRYFLIRDRFGKKPLLYKESHGGVYFASELKALKRVVELQPDRTNLAINMACWLLIQPLTPYRDTFEVRPGHYLEFRGAKGTEHQWYEPKIEVADRPYEQIRTDFMRLYRNSIGLRLRSDVPIGIALSGGLDSSSMAYLARELAPQNFVAFTANIVDKEGWEGITDTENPSRLCRDLNIRQVSSVLDLDFWDRNIVDIVRNYDEVFLNSGTLIFYAIAAAAQASGVKVLLSGVGGDELFGGYSWQSRMRSLPAAYLRFAMSHGSSRYAQSLYELLSGLGSGPVRSRAARAFRLYAQFQTWHAQSLCNAFVPYMRDVDRAICARIESVSEDYFRMCIRAVDGDPYNQIHYANIFTVVGNQNYQVDMASMRHSVENRSPMLDVNLVEYFMSIPDRLKNLDGPKSLMRALLAEFLPNYITSARKSGPTMPLDVWYSDARVGGSMRAFVSAGRELIGDLLSANLASRIRDGTLYSGQVGAMCAFALTSFVLWAKVNVERSIADGPVRFTELAAAVH